MLSRRKLFGFLAAAPVGAVAAAKAAPSAPLAIRGSLSVTGKVPVIGISGAENLWPARYREVLAGRATLNTPNLPHRVISALGNVSLACPNPTSKLTVKPSKEGEA